MNANSHPGMLTAGSARVEITPSGPISMGGYGQRAGLVSRGVHDPLFAKALFLDDGNTRLLFITADLISIPDRIYSRVLAGLTKAGVIDESGLCITASHTHSGPDVEEGVIIASPTRAYLDRLANNLVEVGKQAASETIPVQLKLAVGQADFLRNRRQRGRDDLVDGRVLAVELDRYGTAQHLAVLFGVGCHAVCLGHDNLLISADYPGYAQRYIEKELGVENALFVNLTEGNVIPVTRPLYDSLDTRGYLGGTFEDAEMIGRNLGDEVIRCLKDAESQPVLRLQVKKRSVSVQPTHAQLGRVAAWKELLAQRRIILEYLPSFRKASLVNLKPILTLWRDASAVVIERDMEELEMRRLMSAVSTFLMMAMKLTNPALRKPLSIVVQVIGINEFHLLALPGEALVEVGKNWQECNAPFGGKAFVIGLANGFMGYLPHPDNFAEDDALFKYETIMNALEQDATRIALLQAEKMLELKE
jgi:hypothetical protein